MATFNELHARLSPSSQKKGEQFERICQWYLRHHPQYEAQLEDVWLWDEWPERDSRDLGIDLVARAKTGEHWAIQAKCSDSKRNLPYDDVKTFLALSSARPKFSFRLILTTSKDLGVNLRKVIKPPIDKPVSAQVLSDLESADLIWPESPDDLRAPKPEPKKPRDHQKEAIQGVLKGFKKHDRGRLVMACGTGKTLVGLWVAEKLKAERTLVLLPSLSLLGQTMEEWLANGRRSLEVLAVCSDKTVRGATDAWVSDTSELGIPVTTDPAEIAAFLDRPGPRLVFSTYQSSPEIAKAQTLTDVNFDLALADEAHRCVGPASGPFATVLKAEKVRADRRLFMTATPRYFTGRVKKIAKEEAWEIASMDDEADFGPEFHKLTFGAAIERDLLSPYQVVIIGVDDTTYKEYAKHGEFVTRDGQEIEDAGTLATHIALAKAMKKYDLRRVITFHSRIKRARDFAQDFPGVVEWMPGDDGPDGDLWCDYVSGQMPTIKRKARLDRLREIDGGGRGLLANARCLGEGVDVPTLDGVVFADPRRSQVDIVQNVGRAIRKADDKTVGTIVLPVFIDSTEDPEAVFEGSQFKAIRDVLRALRDHDDDLAEWLDSLRRRWPPPPPGSGNGLGDRFDFDLPTAVGEEFIEAFQTRLVEQTTESWEFWFGLLESFVERKGHAIVLTDTVESDCNLGGWVSHQRRKRKAGRLSPDRVARLEALPGWTWDRDDARWVEGFENLQVFVAREGHANVPRPHTEEGFDLSQWVDVQRRECKAGRLTPDRIGRLDTLPGWVWDKVQARWEEGFERLQSFAAREGDARVPRGYREEGFDLGQWISRQRRERKAGRLSGDRISRLEALPGWTWDPHQARWEEGFEHLQVFVAREGHAQVPKKHLENSFNLGGWVINKRREWRAGRLSSERVARLEELPGWVWDWHEEQWEEAYRQLRVFVAREAHSRVPREHTEGGYNLGEWVSGQRGKCRKGRLSPDSIRRLEELPGWVWDPFEASWNEGYVKLRAFVRREGHSRVPQNHTEGGFDLGRWVRGKRRDYDVGRLTPDRIVQLEGLPGWAWAPFEARWVEGYQSLQVFVAREGHTIVPYNHTEGDLKLGHWVSRQRRQWTANKLSPDRIARLEALPGWVWDTRNEK